MAAPSSQNAGPASIAPGAWHALLLLVLINLFNYIDRQVLAALEPEIRKEFFGEKETDEAKALMGLLSFAFLATYMFAAPYFGSLATKYPRWLLIGLGVGVWSLASGASGLSTMLGGTLGGGALILFGYTMPTVYLIMLLTRCLVGIGEAVYGPVAPDVIADLYPAEKRGQILAWFYAAIPVGGAIGYILGAVTVKLTGHWQNAFYLVVPPGIALAIWCFFMPEPKRAQVMDAGAGAGREAKITDYLFLLTIPSYALNMAGMTLMCFAMGGLAFWAPGYLVHMQAPAVGGVDAKAFFGVLTAGVGLAATILGGLAGDWLRSRFSGSYFIVSGAAMCVGFPMLLLFLEFSFPLAWIPLAGFIFCLFFNTGPTNTINANVVHPQLRSRGFAFNILIIHLLGDAISPTVMGAIIGKENNYKLAFQVVAFSVLFGGLLWWWGSRYLKADTDAAPTRLPS